MERHEVVGWGDLAGEAVARGAGHVHDMHRAIANRSFGLVDRATGGAAAPLRTLHDVVTGGIYTAVRHGSRFAARVGARALGWAWPHDARPGVASPVAAGAQATIVGLIGHELAAAGNPVAWPVRLRADGRDVRIGPRPLARAYPNATGRLVVQLPGLFETEHGWRYRAQRWWDDPEASHARRLAATGWTAVDVQYPSSQPLRQTGQQVADLLRRAVADWPVPVTEVAFLGHSMGGLVARHAVHAADRAGHDWVRRCRMVVCLGAPHGGSPVARAAARAAAGLARLPETSAIADIIELRSPGIRDLEHTAPVPPVDGIDVHAVVAVLSRRRSRVASEVVGDLLVGASSAAGRAGDGSLVPMATIRTFTRMTHFDLLNHPDVWVHLADLFAVRRDRRAARPTTASPTASGPR